MLSSIRSNSTSLLTLLASEEGGGITSTGNSTLDAEIADQMASAAANAAFELATILESASSVGASDAQDVAASLSLIMDVKVASDMRSTTSSATNAAEGITAAVNQLARAAAAGAEAGFRTEGNGSAATVVVVTSKNLNMSIDVRSNPSELSRTPFACDSIAGESALVSLPAVAVEDAEGFNSSLPVAAVLFTTPVNLHLAPQARRRTLSALTSETTSSSAVNTTAVSPTVSFSLTQQSRILQVQNASSTINVSLPFVPSPSVCLGRPTDAESAAACAMTVECRWWNEYDQQWSTQGCTTVQSTRTVACACDHLTEFIAFEFPTSIDELIATLLDAISMQTLSQRAMQCALEPGRTWRTVPVLYGCTFGLLILFSLLMTNAVIQDRAEVRLAVALLSGKKKSAVRRLQLGRMRESIQHGIQMRRVTTRRPAVTPRTAEKRAARLQLGESRFRLRHQGFAAPLGGGVTAGRRIWTRVNKLKTVKRAVGRTQTDAPAPSASPPPSPPALSSVPTMSDAVGLDGAGGSGSSYNQADGPNLGSVLSGTTIEAFSVPSGQPDEPRTMNDISVVDLPDTADTPRGDTTATDGSTPALQSAATVTLPKDFNSTATITTTSITSSTINATSATTTITTAAVTSSTPSWLHAGMDDFFQQHTGHERPRIRRRSTA